MPLLNRIKKYGWIILAVTIAGTGLFYMYAKKNSQTYTAKVMIEYNNSEDGKNPDGTDIDTAEIKNSYVINTAIKSLDLDMNADTVSGQISVEPVVTDEEQALYLAKLEHGEEYTIMSNQYVVTLSADSSYGENYARTMLSKVMEAYYQYYGNRYVDTVGATNDLKDIAVKNYDYIEIMDMTSAAIDTACETLNNKIENSDSFRSNKTGMTFSDLYSEFDFYKSTCTKITAKILNEKITKDRDLLIANYTKKNSDMSLEIESNKKKIEELKEIINSYVTMMTASDNTSFVTEEILDDVYDVYGQGARDKTTSYDELMNSYVSYRTGCEKNDIETAYNEYILDVFNNAAEEAPSTKQEIVTKQINEIIDKLDKLFDKFEDTNEDYNRYLGAQHIKPLSSISVQKGLNIKKYAMIAAIALFIMSTTGFCICSRLYDIFKDMLKEEKTEEGKEVEKEN